MFLTNLLISTNSPMFVNSLPSMVSMEISGLHLQDSLSTITNMIFNKRMVQPRRLILTNLTVPRVLLKETVNHLRQVSEWLTKSTCSFNTIHQTKLLISEERVAVELVLLKPRALSSLESGTKLLKCQMDNCKTLETAMKTLRRWLST